MESSNKTTITVEVIVNAPLEKVWKFWTVPRHITKWNHASDDWHTPRAKQELKSGGRFVYRMEAMDSSFGFDFGGIYDEVKTNDRIAYTLDDARKVDISFSRLGNTTKVVETFEAETENTAELQRNGWQAILNNFKKYVEKSGLK